MGAIGTTGTLTLRNSKGSALTYSELDNNFSLLSNNITIHDHSSASLTQITSTSCILYDNTGSGNTRMFQIKGIHSKGGCYLTMYNAVDASLELARHNSDDSYRSWQLLHQGEYDTNSSKCLYFNYKVGTTVNDTGVYSAKMALTTTGVLYTASDIIADIGNIYNTPTPTLTFIASRCEYASNNSGAWLKNVQNYSALELISHNSNTHGYGWQIVNFSADTNTPLNSNPDAYQLLFKYTSTATTGFNTVSGTTTATSNFNNIAMRLKSDGLYLPMSGSKLLIGYDYDSNIIDSKKLQVNGSGIIRGDFIAYGFLSNTFVSSIPYNTYTKVDNSQFNVSYTCKYSMLVTIDTSTGYDMPAFTSYIEFLVGHYYNNSYQGIMFHQLNVHENATYINVAISGNTSVSDGWYYGSTAGIYIKQNITTSTVNILVQLHKIGFN